MIKVCHIVNLITGKADGVYAHLKSIFRNYDRKKFEHILLFQGGEKVERVMKALVFRLTRRNLLKREFHLSFSLKRNNPYFFKQNLRGVLFSIFNL